MAVTSQTLDKKSGRRGGDLRLFISSLEASALTPRQWLARARGHWKVESGNHYRRDVTWGEDRELGRKVRRACNLALIRSALLGPLLRDGPQNLSALSQRFALNLPSALRFLLSSSPKP